MTNRDDMVIRPRLDPRATDAASHPSGARQRAREERRLAGAKKQGGPVSMLKRARQARRISRARKKARARRRGVGRTARAGAGGLLKGRMAGLGLSAGSRAVGAIPLVGPIIMIAAVALATAHIYMEKKEGRSFENMGARINKILLGDMDEQAQARMVTKHQMMSNPMIRRMIAAGGGASDHVVGVFNDLQEMKRRDLAGRSLFMEDQQFQVNGTLDMLLARGVEKARSVFGSGAAKTELDRLQSSYGQLQDRAARGR